MLKLLFKKIYHKKEYAWESGLAIEQLPSSMKVLVQTLVLHVQCICVCVCLCK